MAVKAQELRLQDKICFKFLQVIEMIENYIEQINIKTKAFECMLIT